MEIAQSSQSISEVPTHIAIIMDGNGRWATRRSMSRLKGHEQGAKAVREAVKGCRELGVPYLTLFAFSSENWNRPEEEVNHLMGLFKFFIKRELKELKNNGVRVNFIGNLKRLPQDIQDLANVALEETRDNRGLVLTIALSYGAQAEIISAVQSLAEKVKAGELQPEEITEHLFSKSLDTGDIPDPDLIIRTSGEKRLSNFLLWQSAYAELVFQDVLWPDFTKRHLEDAIDDYFGRNRRFGAISG
ncbi:isoprenyl transferase [Sneathiella aquimaris]|uniref:isoprenyl transferase n=1 Tax=Sneathiella aquimaris TaxID=2599305 RepID=UPI00146E50F4|nr:isoprenyl transferase [Sneathiella aquimaris]